MESLETFDVVVVGGGPSGATAATDLARAGRKVLMLDRRGRIKPCGGAIPPVCIREFAIPDAMLVAKVRGARIVSPKARHVAMPIDEGYVGMVDRADFDEWLRTRAVAAGAERADGVYLEIERDADGTAVVVWQPGKTGKDTPARRVRARAVIGADGAQSLVAKQTLPASVRAPFVYAYHEIVRSPPAATAHFEPTRCDVYYDARVSPDFYGWVFPHGDTTSVGTGTALRGFSLRGAVGALRETAGLAGMETIRREGAPIPLHPLRRWDNGRDVVVAGDAAGVVAPASGEGIYYAMAGGRLAAEAVQAFFATGKVRELAQARRRFMRSHGQVFFILGVMQRFWYANDGRRERFVSICRDPDVQSLTWEAYMNKELVRARPLAHAKIFFKNLAHLTGLVSA